MYKSGFVYLDRGIVVDEGQVTVEGVADTHIFFNEVGVIVVPVDLELTHAFEPGGHLDSLHLHTEQGNLCCLR